MTYALFAGERYYPSGGWEDCKGVYQTRMKAISAVRHIDLDGEGPGGPAVTWWHVVDLDRAKVVCTFVEMSSWKLGKKLAKRKTSRRVWKPHG